MPGEVLWGAPVYRWTDPQTWVDRHQEAGYRAAYWPDVEPGQRSDFAKAAAAAQLRIAEVGAWSNPISSDETIRQKALEFCRERLALAEEVSAACCVNIAGSRSPTWDGPCAENFTAATFDLIVETVRSILDAVRPTRTFFTLELMPWIWPWNADSYLELLKAVDRPRFAVHLDPANTIVSPQLYFQNSAVYAQLFQKLGPWIKSCHVKDLSLLPGFPVRIEEAAPGLGGLNLVEYLRHAGKLGVPLMLEHLPDEEAYGAAFSRLKSLPVS